MQNGRGGRTDCRIQLRRGRTDREAREKSKRVAQDCVLALEALDQFFLAIDGCGKPIDGCRRLRIDRCRLAQVLKQLARRIDLLDQRIVIAQRAGTCREDVAVQRGFDGREAIEFDERAVEELGRGIERPQRQPREQQNQQEDD